ncbi:MAG: BON domain-containing protein [Cycloclasticus sp. symbiont of Poecilosclerida sp. N]|nr:MAG: BON domain-containing protein [Cycloclasticus sp. symbiont of Poecilosclerida sp. N]
MKFNSIFLILSFLIFTQLSGCAAVHDRRTLGSVIEDESIELKSLQILYGVDEIRLNTHVNATSYNSVLLLTGEVPTKALRSDIVNRLRDLPKVRKVLNELVIAAPSSFISRASDTVVTGKSKIALLSLNHIQGFDPTRVKIVSENGVVYLMGLLKQHEITPVIEVVRRVGGVQRVVKLFEITTY